MNNKITIGESSAPFKIISVGDSRAAKKNTPEGGYRALEKVISKDECRTMSIPPQDGGSRPKGHLKNIQMMILGSIKIQE